MLMLVMPACGRLRWEDHCKFKVSWETNWLRHRVPVSKRQKRHKKDKMKKKEEKRKDRRRQIIQATIIVETMKCLLNNKLRLKYKLIFLVLEKSVFILVDLLNCTIILFLKDIGFHLESADWHCQHQQKMAEKATTEGTYIWRWRYFEDRGWNCTLLDSDDQGRNLWEKKIEQQFECYPT